jgi:hypothetical protein
MTSIMENAYPHFAAVLCCFRQQLPPFVILVLVS